MSELLLDVRAYVARRERARIIAPTTAKNERNVLSSFALYMGGTKVRQIGKTDIERWMGTLEVLADGTAASRFRIVRAYFQYLLDADKPIIRRSPFRGIKTPSTPEPVHRPFTAEQMAALIAAAPDTMGRLAILLGAQAGLRVSEAASLQIGDVAWREGKPHRITVRRGKGGKRRVVPVPDELGQFIDAYLSQMGNRSRGPLLRLRRYPHQGVTGQYLSDDFRATAFASGVKESARDGVSYHALRHTCATDVYRACRDLLVVRDLLGHAMTRTTEIYVAGESIDVIAEAAEGRRYERKAS